MRINTNVSSLNAQESAIVNGSSATNSLEKLSSGLRINKASDDASGLAIADKLRTQVSGLEQSVSNANSAVSMIQIADKAMGEQSNILDIVKQKLIQTATATTSSEGREALSKDIFKLLDQFDNISDQTNYNGIKLLENDTGGTATSMSFQVGEKSLNVINTDTGIRSNTQGLDGGNLGFLKADANLAGGLSSTDAIAYLAVTDKSLNELNAMRSSFGSTQNQIESATRNMMTAVTNIAAAESIIRDVDYSSESANFSKYSIIGNASTYAQTQANAVPQNVLKLLN
ncbi:MAG: flagellin [Arcobacteraceae bacterium]|nr:flagellin [Arcobacteraceae bacterium]